MEEVLYALTGANTVFIEKVDSSFQPTSLAKTLCHAAEYEQLLLLCDLSSSFYHLVQFVEDSLSVKPSDTEFDRYRFELVSAYRDVLQSYQERIIEIRSELDVEGCFSLLHVRNRLNDFQLIFATMSSIISTVYGKFPTTATSRPRCSLIDHLFKVSSCDPDAETVRPLTSRLFQQCLRLLISDISQFVLHGTVGFSSDFFITSKTDDQTTGQEKLRLNPSKMPAFISVHLAESILFCGRAIHLLETNGSTEQWPTEPPLTPEQLTHYSKQFSQLHLTANLTTLANDHIEQIVDDLRQVLSKKLVNQIVHRTNLSSHYVDGLIGHCFLLGRGHFWADLIMTLRRTTLWSTRSPSTVDVQLVFLEIREKLAASFPSTSALSIHMEFQPNRSHYKPTVQLMLADNQLIELSLSSRSFCSLLKLHVGRQSIVDVLITEQFLQRINVVFNFLFNVKNVQLAFSDVSTVMGRLVKSFRKDADSLSGSILSEVDCWRVVNLIGQTKMQAQFFIHCLANYFQNELVEVEYESLRKTVNECEDFWLIERSFDEFLVHSESIMLLPFRAELISIFHVLELCDSLASYLATIDRRLRDRMLSAETEVFPDKTELKELCTTAARFHAESQLSFKLLNVIYAHGAGRANSVSSLIITLDWNGYYSRKASDLASLADQLALTLS